MTDTLGDLKANIAGDFSRDDLTTQIATEITSSIARWQSRRFWFNQIRSITFNTVSAQEFYTSTDNAYIPQLLEIDSIVTTVNTTRYQLDPVDYDYIERVSTLDTATGYPSCYAYYGQQLRLYPIPNGAYSTRISALVRLTALSADTDSNAWTTAADARDLIRYDVEATLYSALIKDMEAAAMARSMRGMELDRLLAETTQRTGTGNVTPMAW